jgi:hypothetical protein
MSNDEHYDNKFFEGILKNNNELDLYFIKLNDNNCKNLNDYLKTINNITKINFERNFYFFFNNIDCNISVEGLKFLNLV